jgi:hypothetical protein
MADINIPSENAYTAKTWFQIKCDDPDTRHLWIKARILCTFNSCPLTALYLFQHQTPQSGQRRSRDLSQKAVWSSRVHIGIRILIDRIVTRWKPVYLSQTPRATIYALHTSLTPERLLSVPQVFGNRVARSA